MESEILYLIRKPSPGYHSIEGLFSTIRQEVDKQFSTSCISLIRSGAMPLTIFLNWIFFLKKKQEKSTVVHITGDIHFMGLVTGGGSILTIHDVQSALKGNFLKKLYIKLFWFWLPAIRVRYITVISDFTKQELSRVIPFAKEKIRVIPNPVARVFRYRPATRFNAESPLILCIGTKENKNLERVIASIEGLNCRLHIIGHLSPLQLDILKKSSVKYLNSSNLSDSEIVKAYQECDLLCFPSTYEGFGMPIIEAQATGRPVITSNFGAMKEIAGESACLVNPYNITSIRAGIVRLIDEKEYREALIHAGLENVKRFEVGVIAKSYMKLYQEISNS